MIGLIVTGHGSYASGMLCAVELLAGKPEHFEAVDFTLENSTDDLEFHLKDVMAAHRPEHRLLIPFIQSAGC